MPYLKISNAKEKELQLYYEDLGDGDAVVFVCGWPLNHRMWEYQLTPLRELGFRCITYDRRGFGKSDQSLNNYSYDDLAEDLHALIENLNLQNVTLVGFSMGGGEVARYCSKYSCEKISKIVLISSVVPYMLKTDDNPDGVSLEQIQEFDTQIRDDRPAFMSTFGKMFFGINFLSHPVSQEILDWSLHMALNSSQKATLACMQAFAKTDFRNELSSITVPALIIHGDADKTVPIKATSDKAAAGIKNSIYNVYENAPHGLFYTHKERLNNDLVSFIKTGTLSLAENSTVEDDVVILPSNTEGLVTRDIE
jgi:pimeloyl-ACP methyl ester carboxylesterase